MNSITKKYILFSQVFINDKIGFITYFRNHENANHIGY